jgi:serine/threonine-protein kinase
VPSVEIAERRSVSVRQLLRALHGDLDAIVCKALQKSVIERYPSVDAFSQDIKRALDGENISARPPSGWYRTRKFIYRNKVAVVASGAVGLALLVGAGVALWQARIARDETHRAEAVQDFLISIFQVNTRNQPDPARARSTTASELLMAADLRLQQESSLPLASKKQLMEVIAHLYNEMDLHGPAAELHARRVALLRKEGRTGDEELARALSEEATNFQSAGQYERALVLLREAEGILTTNKELDSWVAGYVFSCLAQALDSSDGAAAASYAHRATDIFRRTDPNGEALLGALTMVASVERSRNLEAAEAASREALDVVRNLRGDKHALYGSAALYLADIQTDMLKFSDAERNFKIAESVDSQASDARSDLRIQLDLRYGLFLVDQGRVSEAQPRLERALATSMQLHGEQDRAYTAWAHEYLARLWIRCGDLTRAREQIDAAVVIYARHSPDAILAKSLEAQFDVLLQLGKLFDARVVLDKAIVAREASATLSEAGFGEGVLLRRADLAFANHDYSQAAALLQKVASATMPANLRFRRYHYDAVLRLIAVDLALDHVAKADRDIQSLLGEFQQLGHLPAISLQEAQAEVLAGQTQAARGQCDKAKDSFDRAAQILSADQDARSFRLIELARVRVATQRTSCTNL